MDTKKMTTEQWMAADAAHIAPTYGRFPLVAASGKGVILTDEDGKEYIDFGSGIGVTAFGYCDDEWVKAVQQQAALLQHTSNLYYTKPCIELAGMLCERTGMRRSSFRIPAPRPMSARSKSPDSMPKKSAAKSIRRY